MSNRPDESIPKYLRLKRQILDTAKSERWSEGYRLPTEHDFTERYSVSRSTVRQALNELEQDGLLSRQRGRGTFYSPGAPRSAIRNNLVGITTSLSGYIYSAIVRGAEEALSERGYQSVVGSNLLSDEVRTNIESEDTLWRLDGLLYEPLTPDKRIGPRQISATTEQVKAFGMPFVMLNWISEDPAVPWIAPDDIAAGETIGQYLIEHGHRNMAFVGINGNQPSLNRLAGFESVLSSASINLPRDRIILVDDSRPETRYARAYEQTKIMLENDRPLPTAIFFFSDQTAAEGYHAIRDTGLRIPEDISVISYDDSELGRALNPRLTTMAHPREELGRWAARMLVDRIERPNDAFVMQVKIQSEIIERDSVRRI